MDKRRPISAALILAAVAVGAVAQYDEAQALNPQDAAAFVGAARARQMLGRNDEAIALCRKALLRDAKNVEAHKTWGDSLSDEGKYEEAIEHFKQALALDPNDTVIHVLWAVALEKLGKMEEAAEHYDIGFRADEQSKRGTPKDRASPGSLKASGRPTRRRG